MHKVVALLRASTLHAFSYRLALVFSLLGLLAITIPLYLVADALHPYMEGVIQGEASNYFAFVLIGIFLFNLITPMAGQLGGVIGSSISTGTLEALLSTATRLPTLFAGLLSYNLCWQVARGGVLLLFGAMLGAELMWSQLLFGSLIIVLTLLSYLAVGIVAGAMVLVFRTAGPLSMIVLTLSGLLGGVYYPTHVIPSWIETISLFIPLTYGLRSLRRMVLNGAPFQAVLPDVATLAIFSLILLLVSSGIFAMAYRYARRTGTLTHY
jgi:ABC-2 type transport system permease protein